MSFPVITIDKWQAFLHEAAPQNNTDPHKYICVIPNKDGLKTWAVLTQDQYDTYSRIGRIVAIQPCKKLSFSEICSVTDTLTTQMNTQQCMGRNYQVSNKQRIASEIYSFINFNSDISNPNVKNDAIQFVQKLKDTMTQGEMVSESLTKMANRSFHKHLQKKIQGIWGAIQYYIWAWFYDKNAQVKKISQKIRQDNPELGFIEKNMIKEIRNRIYLNCWNFKEADLFKAKNLDYPEGEEDINSPQYVEKWLTKLDPDDCKDSFYKESRDRIINLNRLWLELEKEFSPNP